MNRIVSVSPFPIPWHSSVGHGAEFISFSLLLLHPQKSLSLQLSPSTAAGFVTFVMLYLYFWGHRVCNLLWEVALHFSGGFPEQLWPCDHKAAAA